MLENDCVLPDSTSVIPKSLLLKNSVKSWTNWSLGSMSMTLESSRPERLSDTPEILNSLLLRDGFIGFRTQYRRGRIKDTPPVRRRVSAGKAYIGAYLEMTGQSPADFDPAVLAELEAKVNGIFGIEPPPPEPTPTSLFDTAPDEDEDN